MVLYGSIYATPIPDRSPGALQHIIVHGLERLNIFTDDFEVEIKGASLKTEPLF
jgi:hypothetical protein